MWLKRSRPLVPRITQEATLKNLEDCIARVRHSTPENRAIALDGLAFMAGAVMDDASKEWEELVGRSWERYVD